MDYRKIDKETRFLFREVWEARAEELGFDYISEAVVELYKEKSLREVGEIFGKSKKSIWALLKNWGVERRPRGGKHGGLQVGEKDQNEIHCATIEEIAEEIGLSVDWTRRILKRAQEKFRKNWVAMYGEREGGGGSDREFFDQYYGGEGGRE